MILSDKDENVFNAIKCKMPKFKKENNYWDSIIKPINEINYEFFFTVKSNRSWLYFKYKDQWYKTNMNNKNGIDLFDYFDGLVTK